MPDPRIATTVVAVDWQDNGMLDDVSDDIRATPGVSAQRGKDSARPRAPAMIGSADITLNNQDHRYTSENAGSDIYPFVLPDRPIRIGISTGTDQSYEAAIAYDATDTYYNGVGVLGIFSGFTEEPQESQDISSERHVQFRALGRMQLLRGTIISTTLYSSIRTDEAIGHVLDAAGWPAADRVIATGDTTMNWWWVDEQDAWDALTDLLETEGAGASLYEDGEGNVHFESRSYRAITTRCTTVQATFDATTSGSNPGFTAVSFTQNARDVYNDVSMTVAHRDFWNGKVVWTYGSSLTLTGGQVLEIFAHVDDPIYSVTAPVVTTDYAVTAGSLTSFNATLISATTVKLVITAGGGGVTLDGPSGSTTGPQLRANILWTYYKEQASQTTSADPLFASRTRSLSLNDAGARMEIPQATAQALCDAAAVYYSIGRPSVSFGIVNRDATRLAQIMQRQISDRVHVDTGPNEFAGDVWIEQLNYEITLGGRVARCGIVASRASSGTGGGYVENPAVWDTGEWDAGLWGN